MRIVQWCRAKQLQRLKGHRIAEWRKRVRAKEADSGRAIAAYIKAEGRVGSPTYFKDEETGKFTAGVEDMFQLMDKTWGPVFNLSDNYELPTWDQFEEEFKLDFP